MLFAATYPDRCRALALCGALVKVLRAGKGIGAVPRVYRPILGHRRQRFALAPSRAGNPAFQRWCSRFERTGASPAAAAAVARLNRQIDVSGILPTIRVPTLVIHRTGDRSVPVGCGRFLAEHIPGARVPRVCRNRLHGLDRRQFPRRSPMQSANSSPARKARRNRNRARDGSLHRHRRLQRRRRRAAAIGAGASLQLCR